MRRQRENEDCVTKGMTICETDRKTHSQTVGCARLCVRSCVCIAQENQETRRTSLMAVWVCNGNCKSCKTPLYDTFSSTIAKTCILRVNVNFVQFLVIWCYRTVYHIIICSEIRFSSLLYRFKTAAITYFSVSQPCAYFLTFHLAWRAIDSMTCPYDVLQSLSPRSFFDSFLSRRRNSRWKTIGRSI